MSKPCYETDTCREHSTATHRSIANLGPSATSLNQGRRPGKWLITSALVVVAGFGIHMVVWARQWAFTGDAVLKSLQAQTASRVDIAAFLRTCFPTMAAWPRVSPFIGGGQQEPFVTMRQLTMMGSYMGLLPNHIGQIRAEGLLRAGTPSSVSMVCTSHPPVTAITEEMVGSATE